MLSSVLASSAVALAGLLVAAPAYVDALVTPPGSGSQLGHIAARHIAGISPNHNVLARRKRNVHKNRKRCQQRPPSSTPAPQPNQGSSDNNNNNYSTTSAPASAPAATQPPYVPPSNPGSGKLLLAWPNGPDPAAPYYFTGKARRYYTWSPFKVDNAGNVGFCAMLWGHKQIGDFTNLVKPGYTDCVLGMNEVNQDGQALMSVDDGVSLWDTYIGPLSYQGYSILGSPATTSAPNGLEWIQAWLPRVAVKPTVICIHWYDVGFPKFQEYVINFYNGAGQRHVWITEFACQNFNGGAQCSEGEVWSFVQQATAWMDSTEWVDLYAPFGFMRDMQGVNDLNRLMRTDDQGTPTALGYFFINDS